VIYGQPSETETRTFRLPLMFTDTKFGRNWVKNLGQVDENLAKACDYSFDLKKIILFL